MLPSTLDHKDREISMADQLVTPTWRLIKPYAVTPVTTSMPTSMPAIASRTGPGHFPLMLDPTIRNVRFKKVLIDGGSALNILFAEALTELGLIKDDLVSC